MNTRPAPATTRSMALIAAVVLASACKGEPEKAAPDPSRCELVDLGEATDLISSGKPIPDDQLVRLSGISNPKSILWQDDVTKRGHYIVKIMGTEERLLYTEELPTGREPRILSSFEGTIRLWKNLPVTETGPLGRALARDWQIKVDPDKTYVIYGGERPEGCPAK